VNWEKSIVVVVVSGGASVVVVDEVVVLLVVVDTTGVASELVVDVAVSPPHAAATIDTTMRTMRWRTVPPEAR
jgi:hypothetical protein